MSMDDQKVDEKLHLDILNFIKTSQNRNGVRDNQHIRYRQYCSRRLRRVRVSLAVTSKSKVYTKVELKFKDYKTPLHLTIPLLNAERAWAHAMELQTGLEDIDDKHISKQRIHIYQRLVKAAKHAEELASICDSVADSSTHLQAEGYAAWMRGNVALEKEKWSEAVASFTKSYDVFTKLAEVSDLETSNLCMERAQKVKVYITFCTNKLKRLDPEALAAIQTDDSVLMAKLQAVMDESLRANATSMTEVMWNGVEVKVKNEVVRKHLLQADTYERQLSSMETVDVSVDLNPEEDGVGGIQDTESTSTKSKVYSQIVTHYDDALIALRTDLRDLMNAKVKTPVIEENIATLNSLNSYINYHKLLMLLLKNSSDVVVLRARYDNLHKRKKTSAANSLSNIYQRLVTASEELIQMTAQDSDLCDSMRARQEGYRRGRLFFLSVVLGFNGQHREALALLNVVKNDSSQLAEKLQKIDPEEAASFLSLLTLVDGEVARNKADYVALSSLSTQAVTSSEKTSQMSDEVDDVSGNVANALLLDRLDSMTVPSVNTQYALALPTPIQPSAVKPFLFDLASNYLSYPDYSDRVSKKKVKEPLPTEENTGFWGRIWG